MIVELEDHRPALPGPDAVPGTRVRRQDLARTTSNYPRTVAR
ncbi:hypothetical protein OOZ19_10065 [Saccharopolyspora sp. NFXS83]|nr:hypothetical protein [Saccharopolyspora sp. NFXS83]MCX2730586.1 hypothetical protein [Saccharopolyspora sp. NFXS83]